LGEDDYSTDSIALYGAATSQNGAYFGGITWHNGTRRRAGIASVMEGDDSDNVGLAFFTQGIDGPGGFSESMRISRAGAVGIGTTSPGYKLDVSGTGRFTNPVIVGTPTGDTHAATKSYVDSVAGGGFTGSGTSNYVTKWTGADSLGNSVIYDNGTNVGIGTTSPGAELDISSSIIPSDTYPSDSYYTTKDYDVLRLARTGDSTIGPVILLKGYATGNSYSGRIALIQGTTGGGYGDLSFSGSYQWASREVMRITGSGNVGIGTTSPGYKLDVQGTGRFTNPVIVGTPTGDTHAATKSYVDSAAGGGVGAGSSGQTLRHDGTSWVASSLLYNNGTNVGIGTTNPQRKLHIVDTAAQIRASYNSATDERYTEISWGGIYTHASSTNKGCLLG